MNPVPASGALDVGSLVDGRFRITRLIGQGGYGQVYQAFQLSMGRDVAIKTLHASVAGDSSAVERFQNEARIACQLKHPNTVTYYDFGFDADKGVIYLVMEYLHGETLAERLKQVGPLSLDELTPILEQICGSLSEAHSLGVIHRDIKPENIMLIERAGRANFVKVIDFGIAKAIEPLSEYASGGVTATGALLGSPHYMAPEQIRTGEVPIDRRADIYALGCMVFKALTGVPPFRGRTAMDIATRHLMDAPPRLSTVASDRTFPRELEELIAASLSKGPEGRPTTAVVFFERYLETVGNLLVTPPHLLASGVLPAPPVRPAKPTVIGEVLLDASAPRADASAARERSRLVQAAERVSQDEVRTLHGAPPPRPPPASGRRWGLLAVVSVAALGLAAGLFGLSTMGGEPSAQDDQDGALPAETAEVVASRRGEPQEGTPSVERSDPSVSEEASPDGHAPDVGGEPPAIGAARARRRAAPDGAEARPRPRPQVVEPVVATPPPVKDEPVAVTPVKVATPAATLPVSIVAQPWGRVVVGGKSADSRITLDLAPGHHRVAIEQFGKIVHQQTIDVAPGRTSFTVMVPRDR